MGWESRDWVLFLVIFEFGMFKDFFKLGFEMLVFKSLVFYE